MLVWTMENGVEFETGCVDDEVLPVSGLAGLAELLGGFSGVLIEEK